MKAIRWFIGLPVIVQLSIRQLFFIIVILKLIFHYPISLLGIVGGIGVAYVVEFFCLWWTHQPIKLQLSSVINTTLSFFLMVLCSAWWVYVVSLALGIAQKHFFKVRSVHLYNPSNIAVLLAVFVFRPYTTILMSPLGITPYWWLIFFLLFSGGMLIYRFRLHTISIPFLFTLLGIEWLITTFPGLNLFQYILPNLTFMPYTPVPASYLFYSGNMILFSLLFITDPKTSPRSTSMRIAYGIGIAIVGHFLAYPLASLEKGLFVSVFLLQLLRPYAWIFSSSIRKIAFFFRHPFQLAQTFS